MFCLVSKPATVSILHTAIRGDSAAAPLVDVAHVVCPCLHTAWEPGQAICVFLALEPCCDASAEEGEEREKEEEAVVLHFLLSQCHGPTIIRYYQMKDSTTDHRLRIGVKLAQHMNTFCCNK